MKKSYMNDNLISEGFFSKIKKILGLSSAEETQLKKNKAAASKISNILNDLNDDVLEFEKSINSYYKDMGINKKINIKKYKVTDFLK